MARALLGWMQKCWTVLRYDWPGNVRELRNIPGTGPPSWRAKFGAAQGHAFPGARRQPRPVHQAVEPGYEHHCGARSVPPLQLEEAYIKLTLDHVGRNRKRAAEMLQGSACAAKRIAGLRREDDSAWAPHPARMAPVRAATDHNRRVLNGRRRQANQGQSAARGGNRSAVSAQVVGARMCQQASEKWMSDDAPRLGAAVRFTPCSHWLPLLLIVIAAARCLWAGRRRRPTRGGDQWPVRKLHGQFRKRSRAPTSLGSA